MENQNNDSLVNIAVPEDLADFLLEQATAITTGDRTLLEKNNRQAVYITNNKRTIRDMFLEGYKPPEYMLFDEVNTAYLHALNTKATTPDDCFSQVVIEHGVSEDYISRVRDRPTNHSKDVVEVNIQHPIIPKLQKNNVLDIKSLKTSSTPNQLIDRITKRISVSDRLDILEDEVRTLSNKIEELEATNQLQTDDIRDISISVFGELTTKTKEIEKCQLLRSKNYTIKQISSILKISESTVKRNLAKSIPPPSPQ